MLMNMKDILAVAKENKFALPAFNISDYSMFLGIMEVCEETNSPVIIEIHPDELSFIGSEMVTAIKEKAYKSPVPVCIHLDHCSDFGKIMWAIQSGFTSVMFDGAELPFEENIAGTKKVIEAAHPVNVSVEAELGTIGTTNPDEMEDPAEIQKVLSENNVDFQRLCEPYPFPGGRFAHTCLDTDTNTLYVYGRLMHELSMESRQRTVLHI